MKRKTLLIVAIASLSFIATSCGKHCWCYEHIGNTMTETEAFIDPSARCSTLSTPQRTCVEDGERMDPDKIADQYIHLMNAKANK